MEHSLFMWFWNAYLTHMVSLDDFRFPKFKFHGFFIIIIIFVKRLKSELDMMMSTFLHEEALSRQLKQNSPDAKHGRWIWNDCTALFSSKRARRNSNNAKDVEIATLGMWSEAMRISC